MFEARVPTALYALACLGFAATGASAQSSGKPTKVEVAVQAGSSSTFTTYVALQAGLFKKHNIDVIATPISGGVPTIFAAQEAGQVEVSCQALTPLANSVQRGSRLRFFGSCIHPNFGAIVVRKEIAVPPESGPDSWKTIVQALKGKRIGVSARGAGTDFDTRRLVIAAGMNPDTDITIVAVGGGPSALAALQANQVDALFSYPFMHQEIIAKGVGKLAIDLSKNGPAGLKGAFNAGWIAREDWLNNNKAAAAGFIAALNDVQGFMADPKNSKMLEEILEGKFGVSDAATRAEIIKTGPGGLWNFFSPSEPPADLLNAQLAEDEKNGTIQKEPKMTADKVIWKK